MRSGEAIAKAQTAQDSFYASLKRRGKEVLQNLKAGRPGHGRSSAGLTTAATRGSTWDFPRSCGTWGSSPSPWTVLPLDEVDLVDEWQDMYWKYGQKIYSAAHIVRDDPRLHAIYITNFACGPDSFILHFFKEKMRGKPYLQIEVDEHSADVGAITRLEAFLDSLKNVKNGRSRKSGSPRPSS